MTNEAHVPADPDLDAEVAGAGALAPDPRGGDGLPGDLVTETQLEALLFVAERPLGRRELATITGASTEVIDARLGDLEVTLAERGIRLVVDGDRVALATAPEVGLLIGRYVGREPTRLSPATLETLAIVAYRQPVTKAGIERIRGVDAEYAVRSLLHRRLVVELGRAGAPGRPILYGTSIDFLERFGLLSLDDLPSARRGDRGAPRGRRRRRPRGRRGGTRGPGRTRRCGPPGQGCRGRPPGRRPGWPVLTVSERLGKVLAAAGVASRRGADALVEAGRVTVDGRVAVLGEKADPALQVIAVDGRPIGAAPPPAVHLAVHKPAGVTSTAADRHAARTVIDLVPPGLVPPRTRLYPVGRLDLDSEGLLLLTNDGAWTDRVLHPRHGVEREYAVAVPVPLEAEQRAALAAGVPLEEGVARLVSLRAATRTETALLSDLVWPRPPAGLAWYRVVLAHGWKRQVRRMLAAVGAPVVRLVRVRVGTLRLDLPAGQARLLAPAEVRRLAASRPVDRPPASRAAGRVPASRPAGAPAPGVPRTPSGDRQR